MRPRVLELLVQDGAEVTDVEEAGLRVEPRLLLEQRHGERAMDEEQWCDGERESTLD